MQTACHYKENPPIAHLEAKTLQVYGKKALPKQGKPISYYLLELVSVVGIYPPVLYQYICRVYAMSTVMLALLYARFLAPLYPCILYSYTLFSLPIAKVYRGVSSTSFECSF